MNEHNANNESNANNAGNAVKADLRAFIFLDE
jgi:hypothetical protein